jgi:hypothetical protein
MLLLTFLDDFLRFRQAKHAAYFAVTKCIGTVYIAISETLKQGKTGLDVRCDVYKYNRTPKHFSRFQTERLSPQEHSLTRESKHESPHSCC